LHTNLAYSDTKAQITGNIGRAEGENIGAYAMNLGTLTQNNWN
jgi:hypothetical protein